ncbi:hypothetical protein BD408DRAFT_39357 [Parasitella parasitica]|nr:hypothetical protein BD408DRAFT_39357 [Parasitella parasitica]
MLIKQELMNRIKREEWTLTFYRPSAYFAITCNKEMIRWVTPITSLICKGYCSQFQHLRFGIIQLGHFQLSDDNAQFEPMSIHCSHWINMENATIRLPWKQGDQVEEPHPGLSIRYRCQLCYQQDCAICNQKSRCQKRTITNVMPITAIKTFQIISIQVFLYWIRRRLLYPQFPSNFFS